MFPIEVLSLFPFDDAKVRRFPELAMDRNHFLHKNRISFDVNQVPVFAHSRFVCDNSTFRSYINQYGRNSKMINYPKKDYPDLDNCLKKCIFALKIRQIWTIRL